MAELYEQVLAVQPRKAAAMDGQGLDELTIIGQADDEEYYIASLAAELQQQYHPDKLVVTAKPVFEVDWELFVDYCKRAMGGETWGIRATTCVFRNGEYLGDAFTLLDWLHKVFGYEEYRPMPLYKAIAALGYRDFVKSLKHTFVFLAISVSDSSLSGRLVLELYDDICPKTCENFKQLATSSETGKTYCGTIFHRVVKGGWIQGGDVVDGSGGNSVAFLGGDFEDETFDCKHKRRGTLGMANTGVNANGSQFYITFGETKWMDLKHVAFGRVVLGWDLLNQLEELETLNQRPVAPCLIQSCGVWTPP